MRTAEIKRDTKETQISVKVNLDGKGESKINTPNGFLNHMLELLSKHSGIDMEINAKGDTEVDLHHTIEDTGIALGEALNKALGDRKGIERYASIMMPMDLVYKVDFPEGSYDKEQGFDFALIEEFIVALSNNLKATVHVHYFTGSNNHHIAEAVFKGLARALKQAVKITGEDIPSTKGMI
jgi:imidazoleglycerol-phosphate dehydratase